MNKEEHFFKNRIIELANIAYQRNVYTYSDFLNLYEINILNNMILSNDFLPPVSIELTGGNVYAERKIAVFKSLETYYEENNPISVIKIAPVNSKFADLLNHRDFLGAILNLGIERSKVGDIFIRNSVVSPPPAKLSAESVEAYVYCIDSITDFILENLSKVKHTNIICTMHSVDDIDIQPKFKEIKGTISNIRLDSVISLAFGSSRNSIVRYIESKKVFVNGKIITSNGYQIKPDDIISVRGFGRFIYNDKIGTTKKGRNLVSLNLYV